MLIKATNELVCALETDRGVSRDVYYAALAVVEAVYGPAAREELSSYVEKFEGDTGEELYAIPGTANMGKLFRLMEASY